MVSEFIFEVCSLKLWSYYNSLKYYTVHFERTKRPTEYLGHKSNTILLNFKIIEILPPLITYN